MAIDDIVDFRLEPDSIRTSVLRPRARLQGPPKERVLIVKLDREGVPLDSASVDVFRGGPTRYREVTRLNKLLRANKWGANFTYARYRSARHIAQISAKVPITHCTSASELVRRMLGDDNGR